MEAKVHSLDGLEKEKIDLPEVFETPLREDLIRRAVLSAQSARYQPYSPSPLSGKQTSAASIGKGRGGARVRRTSSGRRVGAFVPQAVGGRRAHPPKTEKRIHKKINDKERQLAIRSAMGATTSRQLVEARGHRIRGLAVPLVVEDQFQQLERAKEFKDVLINLGLGDEMERTSEGRRQRPGKGKMRGRRMRTPSGPLCVVEGKSPVEMAAANFPGVDVVRSDYLNAEVLAPGGAPGRLTIWTISALKRVGEVYG
jgi:large subunit ribosomal protein L4e